MKSVLLFGSESWSVNSDIKKLQSFVNKCLWKIIGIGWPNKIGNEELWKSFLDWKHHESNVDIELPRKPRKTSSFPQNHHLEAIIRKRTQRKQIHLEWNRTSGNRSNRDGKILFVTYAPLEAQSMAGEKETYPPPNYSRLPQTTTDFHKSHDPWTARRSKSE